MAIQYLAVAGAGAGAEIVNTGGAGAGAENKSFRLRNTIMEQLDD